MMKLENVKIDNARTTCFNRQTRKYEPYEYIKEYADVVNDCFEDVKYTAPTEPGPQFREGHFTVTIPDLDAFVKFAKLIDYDLIVDNDGQLITIHDDYVE